jgi:hypothetical protein
VRHCPICGYELNIYPGCPVGTLHCQSCGTLIVGTNLRPIVPRLVSLMQDFHAECLREDRHQCAVWLMASKMATEMGSED